MITDDQILQVARAYLKYQVESPELSGVIPFARHIAALEREECAKVCEMFNSEPVSHAHVAAEIRSRG